MAKIRANYRLGTHSGLPKLKPGEGTRAWSKNFFELLLPFEDIVQPGYGPHVYHCSSHITQ